VRWPDDQPATQESPVEVVTNMHLLKRRLEPGVRDYKALPQNPLLLLVDPSRHDQFCARRISSSRGSQLSRPGRLRTKATKPSMNCLPKLIDARQGGERRFPDGRPYPDFGRFPISTEADGDGEYLFADDDVGPRQVLLPFLELRVLTQSRSGARFQSGFNSAGRRKHHLRGGSFHKVRPLPPARAQVRVPDSMERSRGWARDRR
jgi:hypothetical protein